MEVFLSDLVDYRICSEHSQNFGNISEFTFSIIFSPYYEIPPTRILQTVAEPYSRQQCELEKQISGCVILHLLIYDFGLKYPSV